MLTERREEIINSTEINRTISDRDKRSEVIKQESQDLSLLEFSPVTEFPKTTKVTFLSHAINIC